LRTGTQPDPGWAAGLPLNNHQAAGIESRRGSKVTGANLAALRRMLAMCARKRNLSGKMSNGIYGWRTKRGRVAANAARANGKHTVAEQGHRLGPTLGSLLEGVGAAFRGAFARFADSANCLRFAQGAGWSLVCGDSRCGHRRNIYAMDAGVARRYCGAERRSRASGVAAQRRLGCRCARRGKPWPSPLRISLESPQTPLKLVGVTGTNGKTTTSSLIDSIVRASGAQTGLFRHDCLPHSRG